MEYLNNGTKHEKVYVTKYALTVGIQLQDVRPSHTPTMVCSVNMGGQNYHGNEWHETREEAIAQANKMRDRKIKSLQKQIEKLKALKFE